MAKIKYYSEEELIEKFQSGEYGWLDYINHHSKELSEEFREYCTQRGKCIDDDSAERFLNMKQRQFDNAILNGDI